MILSLGQLAVLHDRHIRQELQLLKALSRQTKPSICELELGVPMGRFRIPWFLVSVPTTHNDLGNSTPFFSKKTQFYPIFGQFYPIFEHILSPHAPRDYALRWDWNTFQRDQPMNMTNVLSNTGTRKARQSRPFQVLDVKHPSVLPVSSRVSL